MRQFKDVSAKEKEDLLMLFYFKNIQIKELLNIFNISRNTVSRIISDDIVKRQKEKEDANK